MCDIPAVHVKQQIPEQSSRSIQEQLLFKAMMLTVAVRALELTLFMKATLTSSLSVVFDHVFLACVFLSIPVASSSSLCAIKIVTLCQVSYS